LFCPTKDYEGEAKNFQSWPKYSIISLQFVWNKNKVKWSVRKPRKHKVEYKHHSSAVHGDDWSASHPSYPILKDRTPITHWTGGYITPELFWTLWRGDKSLAPTRNWTIISQLAIPWPCHRTNYNIWLPYSLSSYVLLSCRMNLNNEVYYKENV